LIIKDATWVFSGIIIPRSERPLVHRSGLNLRAFKAAQADERGRSDRKVSRPGGEKICRTEGSGLVATNSLPATQNAEVSEKRGSLKIWVGETFKIAPQSEKGRGTQRNVITKVPS